MSVLPDPTTFAQDRPRPKPARPPEAWIIAALVIAAFANAVASLHIVN